LIYASFLYFIVCFKEHEELIVAYGRDGGNGTDLDGDEECCEREC